MNKVKEIYLAGGCFWGTEMYFSLINGVKNTDVGYGNSKIKNPTYEEVCSGITNAAEIVKVNYDSEIVSLKFILDMYYKIIDPTTLNRQGNDVGTQYRTGIYYIDEQDECIIRNSIGELQKNYKDKILIEVGLIENYYSAEEYHQDYLYKNPNGYCHIDKEHFNYAKVSNNNFNRFKKKTLEEMKNEFSNIQFQVTQNAATEAPFTNEYYENFKEGIYIDITTGEPLFLSCDKFQSNCGWPAFAKPISKDLIIELKDESHGMLRTEVKSKNGYSHLGHVFEDGIKELGGLRYCINSASLEFISKDNMKNRGYGDYLIYLENQ